MEIISTFISKSGGKENKKSSIESLDVQEPSFNMKVVVILGFMCVDFSPMLEITTAEGESKINSFQRREINKTPILPVHIAPFLQIFIKLSPTFITSKVKL